MPISLPYTKINCAPDSLCPQKYDAQTNISLQTMAHDKFNLNQIQLSSREITFQIHKIDLILLSLFKILQITP